ncbi:MAG: hypothetical protein AAFY22_03835 [Pseudomonadota bacterium]
MNRDQIRFAIQSLLIITTVLHFAEAFVKQTSPTAGGLMIYGIIYGALAIWFIRTPSDKPGPVMGAVIACATGLVLGGAGAFITGGSSALWAMLAIDVVIILIGLWWLRLRRRALGIGVRR